MLIPKGISERNEGAFSFIHLFAMISTMFNRSFSFALTLGIPFLYLVQLAVIINSPNSFSLPANVQTLGIVLSVIGVVIWMITLFQLRNYFGVLPQKQKRLKSGLYKYTNHPMYIGIYLTFLGLSFAFTSWEGVFFLTVIMLPVLVMRASLEDKKLS